MGAIFGILVIAVCIIGAFGVGIMVGITDCKRRFCIPKGAEGVDENGYVYP